MFSPITVPVMQAAISSTQAVTATQAQTAAPVSKETPTTDPVPCGSAEVTATDE